MVLLKVKVSIKANKKISFDYQSKMKSEAMPI
jgi:hypothetical protein